ncbi:chromate transporter [Cohnella terricola]|uniref:Chromate transporter n=1 Tax=Cohnella terricola TaxID=1289167 RepID=A0A559JTU0_9BACL|nr:chromate transporter [Cohnella terricola]TVY03291.1 chromate transporter [Cohnella terricola]
MLIELFLTFFMVGTVSFGGGYAMIPLIQEEVLNRYHWMEASQLADIVAVAGMSPGPIAANIAVAVGYHQAGIFGAIVASLAIILPSLILILAAGKLFFRFRDNALVKSSFFGLRPTVAGMIIYAAIVFAQHSGMTTDFNWFTWSQILIFAGSLGALVFLRKHPISVVLISGLVGIALYG